MSTGQTEQYRLYSGIDPLEIIEDTCQQAGVAVFDHATIAHGEGFVQPLEFHVEGIYLAKPFASVVLHCRQQAKQGGETLLVDGRQMATTILSDHPELAGCLFRYSRVDRHLAAAHRLIELSQGVEVARYQQKDCSNQALSLPEGWTADGVEEYLSGLMGDQRQAVPLSPGDTLVFNNLQYLHGRAGFSGSRKMERWRLRDESEG